MSAFPVFRLDPQGPAAPPPLDLSWAAPAATIAELMAEPIAESAAAAIPPAAAPAASGSAGMGALLLVAAEVELEVEVEANARLAAYEAGWIAAMAPCRRCLKVRWCVAWLAGGQRPE